MNEASPYQPPLPQGPSHIPYPLAGEPAVVKVFGIMHLIFAGLGILSALWGLFIAIIGNPFFKLLPSTPEMQAQMKAQVAMQEKLNPAGITTSILSLLVAIPMIIAGIQLLKKRKTALKWSNIYAFSSISAKAVGLVISFLFVIPVMQQMMRETMGKAAGGEMMANAAVGGAIGGVLISCVYPILTLVLLNRPAVKAWFAHLPG